MVSLTNPDTYEDVLLKNHVMVAKEKRIQHIQRGATRLAVEVGGQLREDQELLSLIANMVEFPEVFRGSFDERYLSLPQEVLISSMREHQKHFSVVGENGALQAAFIGVLDNKVSQNIVENHEWVLEARLIDSEFFFLQDQQKRLAERREDLRSVIYRQGLGSYWEKTCRLEGLVKYLAAFLELNPSENEEVRTAAILAKSDLTTQMVSEFPSLQGIMGGIYARNEGYAKGIWQAIYEQYRPEQQKSKLPESKGSQAVALADKIDDLVGTFGLNIIPTGSRDPYGARRATNGILRILAQWNVGLSFRAVVQMACKQLGEANLELGEDDIQNEVERFVRERLLSLLQEEGYASDTVAAVLGGGHDDVAAVFGRARALHELRETGEVGPLATTFKRLTHIIDTEIAEVVNPELLEEEEERQLYEQARDVEQRIQTFFGEGRFSEALRTLLTLQADVDCFFEHVLVNADQQDVRENRKALVRFVADLFLQFADFSNIEDR